MTFSIYGKGPYEGIKMVSIGPLVESPVEKKYGRFYIRICFAGFNSRANNALGYKSEAAAIAAIRRYQGKYNV
jgi:hypothetical protein